MGIAALVLGILSILLTVFTGGALGAYMIFAALIGIILGAIGKKKEKPLAVGGLVCSIIGLVLSIIMFAACASIVNEVDKELEEVDKAISEYEEDVDKAIPEYEKDIDEIFG
ncbi:MAG: DUF2232 domain-containing protein [Oscillospiraceae bacterium]|nr:DUF2232 domain-containing protein [Oscillospiraceae bacterium]